MEQVKHDTATENSGKRYKRPKVKVVFVKIQGVLCGSNDPMREYDYGSGGFSEA